MRLASEAKAAKEDAACFISPIEDNPKVPSYLEYKGNNSFTAVSLPIAVSYAFIYG